MDFSKFKMSDWLKVAGGAIILIAGFLRYWGADVGGGEVGGIEIPGVSFSFSGFDYFFTGVVPWLLVLAVGVLTFLAAAGIFQLPRSIPAPLVFLAGAALSVLLTLIRFIGPGHGAPDDSGLSRGIGLYLALIATILSLVGTVKAFQESGGDLKDLTDLDKLKSEFKGNDGVV